MIFEEKSLCYKEKILEIWDYCLKIYQHILFSEKLFSVNSRKQFPFLCAQPKTEISNRIPGLGPQNDQSSSCLSIFHFINKKYFLFG